MIAELIDRRRLKTEMKELLADAQVSPKAMTALYLGISVMLNLLCDFSGGGIPYTFVSILTTLLGFVLYAGYALYCMAVRRGERAEFLSLFDGFSFAGKIIALSILMYLFTWLWSLLFVIPGIIAAYRYRFALYNLYENPDIGVMEALDMSKRQTTGYKGQLFMLDLSYIGWTLLASVPAALYTTALYLEMAETALAAAGFAGTLAVGPAFSLAGLLPPWGWTLAMGLWQLVVSLFYFPVMQCVELGYFETAKSTSGVGGGAGAGSGRWDGPDDMGGY